VRPDDEAGEEVAEDDREPEALERDGGHRRHPEDDGERLQELVRVIHRRTS
jgi:hypothetical protein